MLYISNLFMKFVNVNKCNKFAAVLLSNLVHKSKFLYFELPSYVIADVL